MALSGGIVRRYPGLLAGTYVSWAPGSRPLVSGLLRCIVIQHPLIRRLRDHPVRQRPRKVVPIEGQQPLAGVGEPLSRRFEPPQLAVEDRRKPRGRRTPG